MCQLTFNLADANLVVPLTKVRLDNKFIRVFFSMILITHVIYHCRLSFVVAEACLLAGSAKNAYHTKYRGYFGKNDLSCAALRKGVFAAAAAMVLLSLVWSLLFYWCHSKANTGGWQKHENEGLNMNPYPHTTEDMGKL